MPRTMLDVVNAAFAYFARGIRKLSVRALPSLVCACTLAACVQRAAAQEASDTFPLSELVVTATRMPTPRTSVPAAVTVLDGGELRARGVRFVADALSEVAGASVVRSGSLGGLTSLFLRGGESDYVQVMVDGVVVNDAGGAIDLGQLTTDEIERIEVVRGPVSVLYGSDAVTGVIHIFTRTGGGLARVTATAEVGAARRRRGDTSLCPGHPSLRCPGELDLGSYATRRGAAGLAAAAGPVRYAMGVSDLRSGGAYPFNNEYRNRTLSSRIQVGGPGGDASLTARFTDGLYHYPTDGSGRLVDANTFRSSESLALGFDAGHGLGRLAEARLALSYHEGVYQTEDAPDSPADTLGFFASRSDSRVDRRKADLHVNLRPRPGTVATVGVEVERQEGTSAFESRSAFGPFESSSTNDRSNRALYGQLVGAPVSWLAVTAGSRLETNDRFDSFLTWRVGANLRPEAGTVLRASAGNAFKEPTFFENYAEGFTRGNPELEPEQSRSWEVGVEHRVAGGRAWLGATWFDQRFRNLIQYTATPAPDAPNYVNVGEALARGIELELRLGATEGPRLTASWVHLDTEVLDAGTGEDPLFQEGEALIRRPRHRFNVTGAMPLGGRASAGVNVVYTGSREDLDFIADPSGERVTILAHAVADLFGEVRVWERETRRVSLLFRLENALGQHYDEIANFPGHPRTFFLGLSVGAGP